MNIEIIDIIEVRWKGGRKSIKKQHTLCHWGDDTNKHNVGMIITKNLTKAEYNLVPISHRIILLKLQTAPVNV